MKKSLVFATALFAVSAMAATQSVSIETKKIGDAVHWVSAAPIVLHPGDEIELTANHKLEGGFEFHGLSIPSLNVTEQVNRNHAKVVKITVPKDMKAGEYDIGCQFHPKHVSMKFTVANVEAPKTEKKAKKK